MCRGRTWHHGQGGPETTTGKWSLSSVVCARHHHRSSSEHTTAMPPCGARRAARGVLCGGDCCVGAAWVVARGQRIMVARLRTSSSAAALDPIQ